MEAGDKTLAIESHEKLLVLDPNNTNAVKKLKQWRGN